MKNSENRNSRTGYIFILIFFLLATGIVTGGYFSYRSYEKNYRAEVEQQLSAIADLKVNQLVQWRKERLGDGQIFYKNDVFSAIVKRFIHNRNDRNAKTEILAWVGQVQSASNYDLMMLLDAQLNTILVYPENKERARLIIDQRNTDILQSGNIAFQDFYRNDQDQHIYLKILVPILEDRSPKRLIGVLALRISPQEYLYPLIKEWPTPSRTSETLIIRKEGNDALFLNDLKFHKDAALNLRIPLTSEDVPAVRAALGQTGIVEGTDYRGVSVIADVRAVPDSPWFLVARMDMEEVYAPLKERLAFMIFLIGVLLAGAGASVGFVWRQQRNRFYQEQYRSAAALRDSENRYRRLFEAARDGILILDADTGMIVDVNPFLIEMLGYTHEQFLEKKLWELGFLKDIITNEEKFFELRQKEYVRYDDLPLETTNGQKLEVEFVSNVYLVDHHKVIQCNIRDITGRMRAEEALHASSERLRIALESANAGAWEWDLITNENIWSDELWKLYGIEPHSCVPSYETWRQTIHPDDRENAEKKVQEAALKSIELNAEWRVIDRDGSIRWLMSRGRPLLDANGKATRFIGIVLDITERKQAEAYGEMGREILQILNEPGDIQESMQRVLVTLKTRIGFDAVGIRLQEGDDFPYLAQDGFSKNFLLTENTLIERAADGGVCRNENGNINLECTCGLVISGKTDPANPLFTQGGSCWTNDSFPILDIPAAKDPRLHPRNRCIHQGYASIALVPIRTKDRIVGLIQLNDKRKGRFTLNTITLLEGIASHIGEALMRKRAEEALQESEEKFRAIFENNSSALAIIEKDTTISMVNKEYCKIGLYEEKDVIGTSWTKQIPPEDLERLKEYNQKRLTDPKSAPDHYEFSFYRKDGTIRNALMSVAIIPKNQKIICSFTDITERKQAENALREAADEREKLIKELQYALDNVKTLQGLIPICASCKKIRDDKGFWNQVEGYISQHTDAKFTHGICPDCAKKLYGDVYDTMIEEQKKKNI